MIHPSPFSQSSYISKKIHQSCSCLQRRIQGPKLNIKMSYRGEIPKSKIENFKWWQESWSYIWEPLEIHAYTLYKTSMWYILILWLWIIWWKKNHNIMMIDICSSLKYSKIYKVNDWSTPFEIWNKLENIY